MTKISIKIFTINFVLFLSSFFFTSQAMALPAFPGAEGFGSEAIGGRGGTVIHVTNLNNSGVGSFREACNTSGARIIVFDVSGIIMLTSPITISNDYITIAGQTSPGGILIAGAPVNVNANHSIVRHMRFRVGTENIDYATDANGIIYYNNPQYDLKTDAAACLIGNSIATYETGMPCALTSGADTEVLDSLGVIGGEEGHYQNAADIIIDHCSVSWGIDENFSTAYNPLRVSIQWSIFSEALSYGGHPKGEHSKGAIFWNKYSPDTKVSFHHNYMAHNFDRSPLVNTGEWADDNLLDATNNVIYNWYMALGAISENDSKVNWRHNYMKPGLDDFGNASYEVIHFADGIYPLIYTEGNLGVNRQSQSDPEWSVGQSWTSTLLSTDFQRLTPWPFELVTTTIASLEMANDILNSVGATKPVRDSVDTRVIADFAAGTGRIIRSVFSDDYPIFSNPAPPTDTDFDGIPDTWETNHGTNPSVADDYLYTNTLDNTYTNIEAYINDLAGDYGSDSCPSIPSICNETECATHGLNWCNGNCQSENCTIIRADVDQNSSINTTDAMLALRNSLGLDMNGTNWQTTDTTGDVNCDGNSSGADAMLVLRYSLGLDMGGTGWCEN